MKGIENIIEEEIIKPQIKRQVGWVDPSEVSSQSAWNKELADINCSLDLSKEGHETEHLDIISHVYKRKIDIFR